MTSPISRYSDFGFWACLLGIGLAGVPMSQAAELTGTAPGRPPFCDPASLPSRACQSVRTGNPAVPATPGVSIQTEPVEPYGILPQHVTIEEKIEKIRRDGKRSGLPPEVIEKIAQEMEKGLREEKARPKSEPLLTGIVPGDMVGSVFGAGSSHFLFENAWYETLIGKDVMVLAGSMRFDPENDAIQYDPSTAHGFVIIVKGQLGQLGTTVNQIDTPTAVGSLHITSAKGSVLTLESRQGHRFLLNVLSEKLTPTGKR